MDPYSLRFPTSAQAPRWMFIIPSSASRVMGDERIYSEKYLLDISAYAGLPGIVEKPPLVKIADEVLLSLRRPHGHAKIHQAR